MITHPLTPRISSPVRLSWQRRGFTLVETLVAISILLLAVAAPLTLGSQGLAASRIARDQVASTYLIQEAIEFIRNKRDSNILVGKSWLTGLSTECTAANCQIDVPQSIVTQCQGACSPLYFNPGTGIYGYFTGSGWVPTKFTRTIAIQEVVAGVEAKVVVTISWTDGTMSRTISEYEHIFNWQ